MTTQQRTDSPLRRRVAVAVCVALAVAGGVAGLRTLQSPPALLAIAPSERSVASTSTTSRDGLAQARREPDSARGRQCRRRPGSRGPGRRVDAAGSSRRRCVVAAARGSRVGEHDCRHRQLPGSPDAGRRVSGAAPVSRSARGRDARRNGCVQTTRGTTASSAMRPSRWAATTRHLRRSTAWRPSSLRRQRTPASRTRESSRAIGTEPSPRCAWPSRPPVPRILKASRGPGLSWARCSCSRKRSTRRRSAYDRALFAFPRHPYALAGQARIAAVRGDVDRALAAIATLLAQAPTPELAAHVGDLLHRRGDVAGASELWARPSAWNATAGRTRRRSRRRLHDCWPSAIFSHRKRCAWRVTASRDGTTSSRTTRWRGRSIERGPSSEAWSASERARRTGTRDRRILYHAAAIAAARGDTSDGAHGSPMRALDGHPEFDLIAAPAARALLAALQSTRTMYERTTHALGHEVREIAHDRRSGCTRTRRTLRAFVPS